VQREVQREVQMSYDLNGNMTSLTPPASAPHAFGYDVLDDLASYTPPYVGQPTGDPQKTRFTTNYETDAFGRPEAVSLPGGSIVQTYGDEAESPHGACGTADGAEPAGASAPFNPSGALTEVRFAGVGYGERAIRYCRDGVGRPSTTTLVLPGDDDDVQVTNAYDALGLLTATTWSVGDAVDAAPLAPLATVTRTWDALSRVASWQVDDGPVAALDYDADGLLIAAGELSLTRDVEHGAITEAALGVTTTTTEYNGFGEVSRLELSTASAAPYWIEYTRDRLGRVVFTDSYGEAAVSYGYDQAGRLGYVTSNSPWPVRRYEYDPNGNRTAVHHYRQSDGAHDYTVTAEVDEQDRLTRYGDDYYVYGDRGDLREVTGPTGTTKYLYDAFGNLLVACLGWDTTDCTETSPTPAGGTKISYVIDPQHRRIGKTVDGVLVQQLVYMDGLNPIAELDGAGNVVATFVYADRPNVPSYVIKPLAGAGGAGETYETYRIFADQLGSVRRIVRASDGALVAKVQYDEYGNFDPYSSFGQTFVPFGFAGGLYDEHTGLIRFGARDYDPVTGRWTTKDPIGFAGGDTNLYAYVGGDPVNWVDPEGLVWENFHLNPWGYWGCTTPLCRGGAGSGTQPSPNGLDGDLDGETSGNDPAAAACDEEAVKYFNTCKDICLAAHIVYNCDNVCDDVRETYRNCCNNKLARPNSYYVACPAAG
jgi:RHS repeat-associated protein